MERRLLLQGTIYKVRFLQSKFTKRTIKKYTMQKQPHRFKVLNFKSVGLHDWRFDNSVVVQEMCNTNCLHRTPQERRPYGFYRTFFCIEGGNPPCPPSKGGLGA